MGYLDPPTVGAISGVILGTLLVVGGFYVRRRGRLHTRQGAEILAGLAVAIGIGSIGASALYLVGV